jgi:phosphocarrier protein HPr
MLQQELEIINKLGLHARASAKLTQTASQYQSQIWLSRNGKRVNAKSIMGVMMLAASKGSRIGVDIEGEDEAQAMTAIADLINGKFGEGE